jgi:DNA/RNA endonuclease G (NUC1)
MHHRHSLFQIARDQRSARFYRIVLAVYLLGMAGCASMHLEVRAPVMRARHTESAPTIEQQGFAKKNCGDYGMPKVDPAQNFGPTTIIYRKGYVLEHSTTDKIALWVCEGFERKQWDPPNPNRKNVFQPDPELPKNQRAELADYKGSKFDRGHQAPAGDFNNQTLKDESFFLSNMAPQSPRLNQVFWHVAGGQSKELGAERSSHVRLYGRLLLRSQRRQPSHSRWPGPLLPHRAG